MQESYRLICSSCGPRLGERRWLHLSGARYPRIGHRGRASFRLGEPPGSGAAPCRKPSGPWPSAWSRRIASVAPRWHLASIPTASPNRPKRRPTHRHRAVLPWSNCLRRSSSASRGCSSWTTGPGPECLCHGWVTTRPLSRPSCAASAGPSQAAEHAAKDDPGGRRAGRGSPGP